MLTPKVVSHAGITLDLSQVKCFKLSPFALNDDEAADWLIIELKSRIEYVFHPQSRKWEKETINDAIQQQFASDEQATAYLREWEEIWQSYLQDEV
jgi:hypothetical protein